MEKMTKRQKFELLLTIEAVAENTMLVEFINHELELLDRKSASSKDGIRKPSATQLQNMELIKVILEVMEDDKQYSITDLQGLSEELEVLSNQKMSALLKKLVDGGEVEKTMEKRKTLFKKVVDK